MAVNQSLLPKVITPEVDKKQLLLLGLNLLNKGLKLPCAVVQPQAKASQPSHQSSLPFTEELKKRTSPPPLPLSPSASQDEGNRKRKRDSNDDLSEIERKEKRKMMNRVSAQNARDRRKAYVEDLEKKIALLEEKNKKLEEENVNLKRHTTTLAQEKEQLERKLVEAEVDQTDSLQALVKETLLQEHPTQGPAAPSVVSLQQKQFLKQWILKLLLTFSLNCWPTLKNSPQLSLQQLLDKLDSLGENPVVVSQLLMKYHPLLRESPWWGASNSKWNPPKN